MVLSDFLSELNRRGIAIGEMQLRWAYRSGQLPKPRRDGSAKFSFCEDDIVRAVEHFSKRMKQPEAV